MILTTIHQAKGLEWDTVFVIHLADQSFPSKRAMGEEGGLEEERRLFYVAVTRARRKLFLVYPLTSGFDAFMLNQPSLFIEEVSPRLMERMELRDAHQMQPSRGVSMRQSDNPDRSDWNWDGGYSEPSITVDRYGERSADTKTVWKSSTNNTKKPPTSFLRSIDEL